MTSTERSRRHRAKPGGTPGSELPLAYMLRVMNDPAASPVRRDKMAVAAAPYCHARASDIASPLKAERQARADAAAEVFPIPKPPLKLVPN